MSSDAQMFGHAVDGRSDGGGGDDGEGEGSQRQAFGREFEQATTAVPSPAGMDLLLEAAGSQKKGGGSGDGGDGRGPQRQPQQQQQQQLPRHAGGPAREEEEAAKRGAAEVRYASELTSPLQSRGAEAAQLRGGGPLAGGSGIGGGGGGGGAPHQQHRLQPPEKACRNELSPPPFDDKFDDNGFTRTFPQRLMEVLRRKDAERAVVWMPDGLSFVIISPRAFVGHVLPKYFKQTKFASFTRKLNRWGFKRITRGPNAGAYYHRLFQKDRPELAAQMFCQKTDQGMKSNPLQQGTQQAMLAAAVAGPQQQPFHQGGGTIACSPKQLSPAVVDQMVQQRIMLAHQAQQQATQGGQMGNPLLQMNTMQGAASASSQGFSIGGNQQCFANQGLMGQQQCQQGQVAANSGTASPQGTGQQQSSQQPDLANMGMLSPQQIAILQQQKMLDAAAVQMRMNFNNLSSHGNSMGGTSQLGQQMQQQGSLQQSQQQGSQGQATGQEQHGQGQQAQREMGSRQDQHQDQQQQQQHGQQDALKAAQQQANVMQMLIAQQRAQLNALQAQNKLLGMQQMSLQASSSSADAGDLQGAASSENISQAVQGQQAQGVQQMEQNSRGTKLVNRTARGA